MSFHTFEVGYRLNYKEYNQINDVLSQKGSFYADEENSKLKISKVLAKNGYYYKRPNWWKNQINILKIFWNRIIIRII